MTRRTRCVVTSPDPSIRQRRVGALTLWLLAGRCEMRTIIGITYVTLDGVMQSPGISL
jgi:hypothetical protein